MTRSADHNELTDARLVAYLDGVLDESERLELALSLANDPQLAQRLGVLERGGRDFGQAFEPLLEAAPEQRMQDMLAGLVGKPAAPEIEPARADNVVPLRPETRSIWSNLARMAAAAGISLAVFSGGVYTGWQTSDKPVLQQTKKIGWRQAAAQYISLFNKQTLASLPSDKAAQDAGLQRVSQAVGLSLTRDKTTLEALSFKGTQVLALKGKPLIQIAYLHNNQTPVALCIIKSGKPAQGQKTETRLGLNIVHWIEGGHGYMLIGKVPQAELQKIAAPLVAHFS